MLLALVLCIDHPKSGEAILLKTAEPVTPLAAGILTHSPRAALIHLVFRKFIGTILLMMLFLFNLYPQSFTYI